jgi:ElaB/YqjD/DUF883 family membrane-anchored ribosome-binding protein
MNTQTKTMQDVPAQPGSSHDSNKDKLIADLKTVVADGEKMIREAADSSADSFVALRARFEATLNDAKAKLVRARSVVQSNAQCATDSTQAYVRENPWKSAGVTAAAGVVVGFLLGRRKTPGADQSTD